MAEVLRLSGRLAEAIPYAQRALEALERKGNIAGAAGARELLGQFTES
jgi:hypothetical protein